MKRFLYVLLCLVFHHSYSQITVSTSSLPTIGDTFTYFRDTTSVIANPPTGATVFDFSSLKNNGLTQTIFRPNDDTFSYPQANIKMEVDNNISNGAYYKRTSNDLLIFGLGALNALPQGLPIASMPTLNGTLKYCSFPLNSTSNILSADSIRLSIPASLLSSQVNIDSIITAMIGNTIPGATIHVDSIIISIIVNGKIKTIGYGKITTPVDTSLDVLKVERTTSIAVKAAIKLKATIGPITIPYTYDMTSMLAGQIPGGGNSTNQVSHIYYSNKYKQEIFSANLDSTNNYNTILYRYKTGNSTIPIDTTHKPPIDTTHKPADTTKPHVAIASTVATPISISTTSDKIVINNMPTNLNYTASIISLEGREIISETKCNGSIDISNLSSGLYFVIIDDSNLKKSFKFTKRN